MSQERRPETELSRRGFLAKLLMTSGAATATPFIAGHLASSIVAASDTRTLSAKFVAGTLIEAYRSHLVLSVPGYTPDVVTVHLLEDTQICKRGCPNDSRVLELGDRIYAGTKLGLRGRREAIWIHANGIASWGVVTRISTGRIALSPMPRMNTITRDLIIEPYTRVFTDGGQAVGAIVGLGVGDNVYYTGTGLDSNLFTRAVWAFTVHRTGRLKQ